MTRMKSRRWGILAAVVLPMLASRAGVAATPDNQITFDQVISKWTVAPDGTWVVEADVTIRAPKDNPSHVVRVPVTWSASTEKLQVVQARIDKPDGRSVILANDAARDDPPVGDEYFHEFSDEHRLLITFTGAEPNDLLVVRTRRDVFRPRVPGGFMAAPVLDRSVGWEETNYTISVPASMPFRFEVRDFDHDSELIKDRMVHYFHSPKVSMSSPQVAMLGSFDRLPRFAVSTFRDYDEFAKAYASVLLPHAKVTPAVAALATSVTEGLHDKGGQARALFGWVRDHVRHIPIPLEESLPDPHDADQVITNRYGDDKDHVVLLDALYAAIGIPAEIVLVNNTNDATIAEPPNVRPMNHLILYLPGPRLYLDSTVPVAPFAILPFGELGKPAIYLGGRSGDAHGQIPMPASAATQEDMKTDMTFAADGTVSGTTTTTARGAFGIWLRNAARSFGEDKSAAAVTLLRQHGTPGTGTFSFDSPTAPGDEYKVRGTFQLQNQSALLNAGFFAIWTGLRLLPRPGDVLGGPMFLQNLRKDQPTFCYPGLQTEELSLTLPPGRVLGGLPADVKIDSERVRYRSHWAEDGQRVTVTREFQSLMPGPVCEGLMRDELADELAKVRADLVTPVGVRQDVIPVTPLVPPPDASKQ
jgi:transglutaminase-like putative cysteine protease